MGFNIGERVKIRIRGATYEGWIDSLWDGNDTSPEEYWWVTFMSEDGKKDCTLVSETNLKDWNTWAPHFTCHCGAESIGIKDRNRHSTWCPIYVPVSIKKEVK